MPRARTWLWLAGGSGCLIMLFVAPALFAILAPVVTVAGLLWLAIRHAPAGQPLQEHETQQAAAYEIDEDE